MLNPKDATELINASAELLTKAAELEQQNAIIPVLQREKKEASDLAAALAKEAANQKNAFRARAEQSAAKLAELGFRVDKENFVRSLEADPLGAFGVIEKIAADTMVPQLGAPDPSTSVEESNDPLYRFAMGQ